jgi:hypothetical protein
MFFPTDSVATWLGRGVVWTLSFELLLVALSPFELALWSTGRGERLSRRVEAKRAILDHESPTRRMGRRAGLALSALALPLALIAFGVSKHIPTGHPAPPPKVTKVTRVVRVVKPVRVERVVKVKTVSQQVPATAYRAPSTAVNGSTKQTHKKKSVQAPASPVTPKAHVEVPASSQPAPSTPTGDSTTTASGSQSSAPPAGSSGAAAQPTA